MIDAWSDPSNPPNPQQFKYDQPNGIRKLLDRLDRLERLIGEKTSNLLGTAGIRLTRAGMFIDSSLNVDGDLNVSGHAAITGTLSLPAGIIDNAALASPVVPASRWLDSSNFGLTVAWAAKVTISVTVPAGFTKLQVMAAGRLSATNSTATQDGLFSRITIGAVSQSGFPTGVDPGKTETSVTANTATLTGLTSGGTVNIVLWGSTGNAAWATYAANAADLSASLLWLR